MLLLKSFIVWALLLVIAILNGGFREKFSVPAFGEQSAHVLSTLMLIFFIFTAAYIFVRIIKVSDARKLLLIGIFWLALTVIFEFTFGHFVLSHPWERLFADYNIFSGRVWVLVLLANLSAPLICGRLVKRQKNERT